MKPIFRLIVAVRNPDIECHDYYYHCNFHFTLAAHTMNEIFIIPLGLTAGFTDQIPEIASASDVVARSRERSVGRIDDRLTVARAPLYGQWRCMLEKRIIPLPKEFLLYFPILFMMLLSLLYTPNLSGGIDKTAVFHHRWCGYFRPFAV